MPLWKFTKDSAPATGANTRAGILAGGVPYTESQRQKRNIVLTNSGWVRRQNKTDMHSNARLIDEVVVAANPATGANKGYASNTSLRFPELVQVFVSSNSTFGTSIKRNALANVYIVFNHSIAFSSGSGKLKLTLANTISGNAMVLASNTTVLRANNTVILKFKPTVAGTYKINAQTLTNATATAVVIRSKNAGAQVANLVLTGAVSNALGTFVVRTATAD